MPIERGQAIEWRVVWPVVDLHRCAPPGSVRNREHQHDEIERPHDGMGEDDTQSWQCRTGSRLFEFKQHLEMIVRGFPGLGCLGGEPLLQKLFLARREHLFDLV